VLRSSNGAQGRAMELDEAVDSGFSFDKTYKTMSRVMRSNLLDSIDQGPDPITHCSNSQLCNFVNFQRRPLHCDTCHSLRSLQRRWVSSVTVGRGNLRTINNCKAKCHCPCKSMNRETQTFRGETAMTLQSPSLNAP
jgi:hypothetical protein